MSRLERLSPVLKEFVQKGPAGCAVMVAQRGRMLYEQYEGFADLESRTPIAPDTIYRQYSMSKVITCAAALMLYERGLFGLNDPLSDYLPEFANPQVFYRMGNGTALTRPAANPILVKDLFMMSSGLTYPGDEMETARLTANAQEELDARAAAGQPYTVRDMSKALAKIPLAFDPGTHWKYGLSHDVLGALIEVVSGKKFGQFLYDEIFEPLGMADTSFRIEEGKRSRLCSMYAMEEVGKLTKVTHMDANFQPGAIMESGGGGLLCTVGDYTRFAQVLAAGGELDGVRLLSRHTVRLMATDGLNCARRADYDWPQLRGYGYGLGVRVLIDPSAGGCNSSVGEFGWCGMAGTIAFIDPVEQLTVVYAQQLLPNQEAYHMSRLRSVVYGAI